MARWMTSGRCDSGGSRRSSARSVSTRPSSNVCFSMRKSEYNKRIIDEQAARARWPVSHFDNEAAEENRRWGCTGRETEGPVSPHRFADQATVSADGSKV